MMDYKAMVEVATKVRRLVSKEYGVPPHGACLKASRIIAKKLRQTGEKCRVISGRFVLDNPDMEFYDDDRLDGDPHFPLHWWVRVGTTIIDVTADQFANEVDDPIKPVCIGDAKSMWRWQPMTSRMVREGR